MSGGKYLYLSNRQLDKLLLELILTYENYNLCEVLLLMLLCTEMGEA